MQIESLTPQLVNAGKIRMEYPTNKAADEHFENLRKQFADGMQVLPKEFNLRKGCFKFLGFFQAMRNLVDDQLDSAGHLKCIEEAMRRHSKLCEDAMVQNNPQKMVDNTSAIARLANRALMVGKRESDNSEDPSFVNKINTAADRLQSGNKTHKKCESSALPVTGNDNGNTCRYFISNASNTHI